jgi:hypothetical protein
MEFVLGRGVALLLGLCLVVLRVRGAGMSDPDEPAGRVGARARTASAWWR